jgi:hypothetical protein
LKASARLKSAEEEVFSVRDNPIEPLNWFSP